MRYALQSFPQSISTSEPTMTSAMATGPIRPTRWMSENVVWVAHQVDMWLLAGQAGEAVDPV